MRIDNIITGDLLAAEAKHRNRGFEQMSVRYGDLESYKKNGWVEHKEGVQKIQVRRDKALPDDVEDRMWMVLYGMGFRYLSGSGGGLLLRSEDEGTASNQIDVLALDEDSGVLVECKSAAQIKKVDAQDAIHKLVNNRNTVREILNKESPKDRKRRFAGILVLWNLIPSNADLERARAEKILILDKKSLEYYERLVQVLGPASRFQMLAELFANQEIDGLKLRVPAVEARLGENRAYTFAILPKDLLKIAYVAHRSRKDTDTYQRMVNKKRLKQIREFIDSGGIFPTNIVINFNGVGAKNESGARFQQTQQEDNSTDRIKLGWLTLPARYQSAWIIDGQHRLMAFSDHDWSGSTSLIVTAFDCMPPADQAQMFVDINHEQRKVSAGQLLELQATLNEGSDDPRAVVASLVSRTAQDLGKEADSPFFNRIVMTDETGDDERSITIKAISDYLRRGKLFIASEAKGKVIQYGPLWRGQYKDTLKRTKAIVNEWFSTIRDVDPDGWERGRGPGGLVAMNTGVSACLEMLRNAVDHLKAKGFDLSEKSDTELSDLVKPYAKKCGDFFASLSPADRDGFRSRYGAGGPAELARMLQDYLNGTDATFSPDGLDNWRAERAEHKVADTQRIVGSLEQRLHDHVIGTLKEAHGEQWWPSLPTAVRKGAVVRKEDDTEEHPVDTYLNLIDYREIVTDNWQLFQSSMSFTKDGNKDKKTDWIVKMNTIRNKANHSSGARLTMTDYEAVRELDDWMRTQGI